jgi:DNA-binding IclR family transcriptional regulator
MIYTYPHPKADKRLAHNRRLIGVERDVLDHISRNPGARLRELQRATGHPGNEVADAAMSLVSRGLVRKARGHGLQFYRIHTKDEASA